MNKLKFELEYGFRMKEEKLKTEKKMIGKQTANA